MSRMRKTQRRRSASSRSVFRGGLLLSVCSSMVLPGTTLLSQGASAETAKPEKVLEEVMVTGSRRQTGSVADVPAPVDIIGVEKLSQQASADMSDLLSTTIPSLNVGAHPISGSSTGMRPPTLRGLSPDHTLVLVNGKRRHRGAEIPSFTGGITDGSQGPDLSSIPAIAIKQVQVLRDGAAAQYGSDAVAGVINFILNDAPEGGKVEIKLGSTYEGDGDTYQVAGTWGIPLGNSGFIRFSGEYHESDLTERAVQRGDAAALMDAGYPDVPNPATRFGTPDVDDDLKVFVNMAVDSGNNRELYGFGSMAKRKVGNDLFYRNPTGRFGVFTDNDDGGNYLIGDMTPGDGVTCDGGIDFGGTGVVNNPIAVGDPNAAARLAGVFADPNCFSFLQYWPGGYTPFIKADIDDIAGVLGVRGELDNGLTYDVSAGAGRSSISWAMSNVPNPSLGSMTPTAFGDVGTRVQFEKSFNVDLSYPLEVSAFASPLNVAVGFEWRNEEFKIEPGQLESFQAGVLADQGFLIGEEAIPGFSPSIAGTFDRSNIGFYVDLEADVTSKLVLGVAARYEDFDDFGDESTFKLSGLYHITEALGVRATVSTGFHAPTPGQQNFSNVTTEIDNGSLIESGVIPPTNPVAVAAGATPLDAETSESFTIGLVYESELLTVTLDYYFIEMEDRITQSASHTLSAQQIADLVAAGFPGASGLGSFRFFTNDFDSETEGVDLVATVPLDFGRGNTELSLVANWTKTDVTSFDPSDPNELLSQGRVVQLEENNPEYRGNLTLTHVEDNWRALARVNYYGSFTELHVNALGLRVDADEQITVDVEAAVNLTEKLEFIVGAQNVFDEDPTRNPWDFIVGSKYPTTAPAGINGGFYYAKMKYDF